MRLSIIPPKKTYKIDELLTKCKWSKLHQKKTVILNIVLGYWVMGTLEAQLEAGDKLISGNGKN